ncbi:hypothetical protein U1Q18_033069 [Sarracenia purpurea var. burkii]
MVSNGTNALHPSIDSNYDRRSELKSFDDTRADVKGLVDAAVPRIFVHPLHSSRDTSPMAKNQFRILVINLTSIREDQIRRNEVIGEIWAVVETGGFFQLINHGIPGRVLEEALDGTRRFFKQDVDVRYTGFFKQNA